MESVKRINILGCPFDVISFSGTVALLKQTILQGQLLQIVPGSIDFVMKAKRDPIFAGQLRNADLVVADGVPIVWAASLLGNPLVGRVSGTDLVWSCAEISAETGCTIAVIGGMPGVALRAAKKVTDRYPRCQIHALPTPFPLGVKESEQLAKEVRSINAKILLVALGAPRQERWVQSYLEISGANVGIGIGGAFDIISGDAPRAPRWMRDNGLEWLHRITQDPKRLSRRYLIEDSPFLIYLAIEIIKNLFKRRSLR